MISFYIIKTIALYEIKNLLRSWFFRIFSLLALTILALLNVGFFTLPQSQWMFRALPASIPYFNLLLLNVVQAVIGVFLASDFMKYDNKLDTTDTVYIHSMTNADYVLGKTLGIMMVFGGLNMLVLITALVFNVFFTDVPFLPEVYGFYSLLISLPTLIFIFGLSFLIMSIVQSQAMTFIILLGYIASTVFFLGNKFHYLFDYMAFNVPLMYSDFVGFGHITNILIHRGLYFFFGIGFICVTILKMKRLPQSRFINKIALAISVCSIALAVFLGGVYIEKISAGKDLRSRMSVLNKQIVNEPKISIKTCNLDLTHNGEDISVQAQVTFTNDTAVSITHYRFSLNPGLKIQQVTHHGEGIGFSRDLHILTIEPPEALAPGTRDSLTISYRGTIDEDACYPDIDETTREENFRIMLFNIGKHYSFITPEYVLLSPENLWYPVAGIPYFESFPSLPRKDFVSFTLHVVTDKQLTAVSQGAVVSGDNGEFMFTPEVPLPRLSLAIGRYKKYSVTVDNIDYNLFYLDGHDYFSKYFTELGSTLPELIHTMKDDFENRIGMSYPYHRLSLIETPIQFYSYPRFWTLSQETVQPEQILLPEKGMVLSAADFRMTNQFMQRQTQRGNQALTPEEIQSNLFRRFVTSTFTNASSQRDFIFQRVMRSPQQGGQLSLQRLALSVAIPTYTGNFSVFPLYFSYIYHFSSEKWPVFASSMEFFLNERMGSQPSALSRLVTGLSNEERANLALMKNNLNDILANPKLHAEAYNVLKIKTSYLFALIQSAVGAEAFRDFLDDILESHRFNDVEIEDFAATINERFSFDLEPYLDSWLYDDKLPAFFVGDATCYEVLDQEKTRYQVTFTVSNPEPVDGIISVDFRLRPGMVRMALGGGGQRGRMQFSMPGGGTGSEYLRFIRLSGGETKEVRIVLDELPSAMTVNTYISQNIPSTLERGFGRIERNERAIPFDGELVLDKPIHFLEPGEIVVDNEDSGFKTYSHTTDSFLKRLVHRNQQNEDEYSGFQFRNIPRRWKAVAGDGFYGTYRLSADYIRAGKGENKVAWEADVPQSGEYDVYYYITFSRMMQMQGRGGMQGRGQRGQGSQRGGAQPVEDFHFTIHHEDGVDEVELNAASADAGWNAIGTFYFSEGKAVIELSDKSKGRIVYADAVKLTQHVDRSTVQLSIR
ncbi:MAG TPA: hypothetical protein VMZ04_06435 [Anaerolineae bacterium]|nr:hypothetical protein [Anaerolineae bacterium]